MLFSARISTSNLVDLCNRVGNQLHAGVDARRVWRREAERTYGIQRLRMETIAEGVERGLSTSDAINSTGEYFPLLFRQMVELGDATGHMDRIFKELAGQYQQRIQMQRSFLAGILWPMIQLTLAILIVGLLIFVSGIVTEMTGQKFDMLGLGLIGTKGAIEFFAIVGVVIFGLWATYLLWSRGKFSFLPLDRFVMNIPGIGTSLRTLALARMAWTMALTLGGGMEIRRLMRLALMSTQTQYFTRFIPQVDQELLRGEEIHDILRRTHSFPNDFLDVVETGEMAGTLTESMERLAEVYQDRARSALAMLVTIAGFLVWLLVAALIIALIMKIFMTYLGGINDALNDLNP